ncbi:50S ribosomal protein L35 [[Mycoplasma] mobile]|nr:50S ribosomal protein L35 [[Mycoplasma] mobile]
MAKNKMKPKKALAKRIKISSTGKVKFGHAFRSHLAQNKSTKQKRQSKHGTFMHPTDYKRLKDLM